MKFRAISFVQSFRSQNKTYIHTFIHIHGISHAVTTSREVNIFRSIIIQVTTKNKGPLIRQTHNFLPRKVYNVDRITEQRYMQVTLFKHGH
jgi:hypothetical protein